MAWFGLAHLLPVVDAAAVAGGWQPVWTWVQRVGVVAGVVTMAVLWSRTKARQAFVRLNAGWAAIEPRLRKLPKAPKLPKALNLTPEMRTLARWVIRKVLVGKVSVTEAAAQLGVALTHGELDQRDLGDSRDQQCRDRFRRLPAECNQVRHHE